AKHQIKVVQKIFLVKYRRKHFVAVDKRSKRKTTRTGIIKYRDKKNHTGATTCQSKSPQKKIIIVKALNKGKKENGTSLKQINAPNKKIIIDKNTCEILILIKKTENE